MKTLQLISLISICILPVLAQADDKAAAREHYLKGTKAFDLGFYEDAIQEYMLAYQQKDDPVLLYDLAQANRLAGHTTAALRYYKIYLTKAPKAPNRPEIEVKIAELQKAVEQQARTQRLPPDEPITPGTPRPAEPPPPRPMVPLPPVVVSAPPPVAATTPPPDSEGRRRLRWAGVGVGALALASLAVGAGMGALARSESDQLTRDNRAMQPFNPAAESTGRTAQALEGALLGVGVVAALTATALYVVGRKRAPQKRAFASAVRW